mmetsp:Transcript_17857/g.44660  ORF Transcript_17857/g.44660 Transcript_17857/m.44660 type:complete len:157 (-) Transcript_17857:198-668(-)
MSTIVYSAEVKARPAVLVEEAKTSRSSCRACGQPIAQGSIRVGVPAFVSGRLVTAYQHPKCFLEKSVTFDEYETKGGSCQCKAMRTKINRGELRCVINTGNSKFSLCAKALKLLKPAVKMTGAKTIKPAAFVKGSGIAKLKNAKNKKVVEKELGLK